jgi:hypothetical protein
MCPVMTDHKVDVEVTGLLQGQDQSPSAAPTAREVERQPRRLRGTSEGRLRRRPTCRKRPRA